MTRRLSQDLHVLELAKGGAQTFIVKLAGLALSFVLTIFIARNLGTGSVGIYALSLTIAGVSCALGKLGLETAVLRFTAEFSARDNYRSIRKMYLLSLKCLLPVGAVLSIAVFLLSPLLSKSLFHTGHLSLSLKVISLSILPAILYSLNAEALRGLRRIKEYSFLQSAACSLFSLIILWIFLSFSSHVLLPVFAYTISVFFVMALSFYLWLNAMRPQINGVIHDDFDLRGLLKVSFPMFIASFSALIMGWADTIILGLFRSEVDVGIYNVAFRVALLPGFLLIAVNSIAGPKFAEHHGKGDIKNAQKTAQQSTKLIFLSSLPVIVILLAFPERVLSLFGSDFTAGKYVLILVVVGQLVNCCCGSVALFLNMTGRHVLVRNVISMATLLNITLNLILIPRYGIHGAALATMTSTIFWNVILMIYIHKVFDFWTISFPLPLARSRGVNP
jgi:O-antigen/teichoic acid export membrane protein